jgi:hypothetical protein
MNKKNMIKLEMNGEKFKVEYGLLGLSKIKGIIQEEQKSLEPAKKRTMAMAAIEKRVK